MNCRYDDCKYYELWDSSYDDGEEHHDHRVCFCHHNGECEDNWDIDEEHECPYMSLDKGDPKISFTPNEKEDP